MDRWEKSVYVQIQIVVSEERGIFYGNQNEH